MTAAILAVVLPASLSLSACGSDEQVEVAGPELLRLGASQVMTDMETFMSREGVKKAHLLADTAFFLEGESGVNLRGVKLDLFGEQGGTVSTLTARRGWYEMQTEDMRASGDVVVVDSATGRRLETERLEYRAAADELRGDTAFVFYRGSEVIRGQSFVTDPGLNDIRTTGPSGVSRPSGGTGGER